MKQQIENDKMTKEKKNHNKKKIGVLLQFKIN